MARKLPTPLNVVPGPTVGPSWLVDELDEVLLRWCLDAAHSEQTMLRMSETVLRFAARLTGARVASFTVVSARQARGFVLAPTADGRLPEVHTQHARRTAFRMYRPLRTPGRAADQPWQTPPTSDCSTSTATCSNSSWPAPSPAATSRSRYLSPTTTRCEDTAELRPYPGRSRDAFASFVECIHPRRGTTVRPTAVRAGAARTRVQTSGLPSSRTHRDLLGGGHRQALPRGCARPGERTLGLGAAAKARVNGTCIS
jgi:hypothetical protein